MPLHYTGRNIIASLLLGTSVTPLLTTTGAVMWVGSGTAAHDPADNHLKGTSVAATMVSGYPINSPNNRMTFRGVYSTLVANFEWQEWGMKNSTSSASSTAGSVFMLQRKQESLGTKANTQQWQLTLDLDITT